MLILSLFPGIGILDRAFEECGFCVVRGPDVLWGGDIRKFHPPAGKFDGVIGGPPCQAFSSLVHLVRHNGYEPRFGNPIPEYERCVKETEPQWFLMENVRKAPEPNIQGYAVHAFEWDNSWLGEEQMRRRKFCFGVRGETAVDLRRWMPQAALELPRMTTAVVGTLQTTPVKIGGSGKLKPQCRTQHPTVTSSDGGKSLRMSRYKLSEACRLQGLPEDFLEDAPFTKQGKLSAVANGVPLPLGRALAEAVKNAVSGKEA